jgi:hypothetical protein
MTAARNFANKLESLKTEPDPQNGDAHERVRAETASLAAYIAEMSAELSLLAARSALPMLAHFLNLAHAEAEIRSRELGGSGAPRRRLRPASR